ncbi:hypothetical protein PRIPAC_75322 [Pristionchus pacificus]|uniref:Uncharacterized protein n=1 Tax=Pristionchus pacificus TaxID=54126 RepID=A0A2A6BF53_PRIPA|nr:hypothetical protein PRIPAC_75322 [Pristionchus pacificus]|eukprot:PDM64517.1 hypothetical protein PRIPAC_52773 [Pristionchus pacificus]
MKHGLSSLSPPFSSSSLALSGQFSPLPPNQRMRLLAIFLILYVLQVAAGVAPCDPSLINEGSDPTAEFEFNDGVLKCKDNKEIVLDDMRYDDLNCDIQQGLWIYGKTELTPSRKANELLNITCRGKACGISNIKGVKTSEIQYNGGKLNCTDGKQIVVLWENKKKKKRSYDELNCDAEEGWMSGSEYINPRIHSKDDLNIECRWAPCHKSFINGVVPGKDANYDNNILTCKNPKQIIEYSKLHYDYDADEKRLIETRKCEILHGRYGEWYGAELEGSERKLDYDDIHVKCVAQACNPFLIFSNDGYTDFSNGTRHMKPYNATDKMLECKESFEVISYRLLYNYHGKPELSKTLTCNLESGKWKSDEGRDTEISAEDEIVVGCEVIACHKDLINGTADKSEQSALKCDDNKVLQIQQDSNFYKTLKCSDGKWFNPFDSAEVQVKPATEKLTIDSCTYEAPGIGYDRSTRTLTCHPGDIKLGEKSYKSLTCNSRVGWSDESGSVVANAEQKLVGYCKSFCTTTANVNYKMSSDGSYAVTCKELAVMLYGDIEAKKEVREMTCNVDGWTADGEYIGKSETELQQLECKKACNMLRKPKTAADGHSSDDSKWENGLTDLAKETKSSQKYTFKCKNNQLYTKYVIKLNDNLVDSHLNCDIRGYTDKNGRNMASALDSVKIACVKICETTADVKYKLSYDGSYVVTCKKFEVMNYDDGTGMKEVKDMRCSVSGWKRDGADAGKSDSPLEKLECKKPCTKPQKPKNPADSDPSDQSKWEEGLTDFAEVVPKSPGKSIVRAPHHSRQNADIDFNIFSKLDRTCSGGKIFYKQRGAAYFEEGAKRLTCDTMKGVWTVEKEGGYDELRRGGHVICADSNPLPNPNSPPKANAQTTYNDWSIMVGLSIGGILLLLN